MYKDFFILQYPTEDSLISADNEGNDAVLIWVIKSEEGHFGNN